MEHFEIAYVTRTGKHGRKVVRSDRIEKAVQVLRDRDCYGIYVSRYPVFTE